MSEASFPMFHVVQGTTLPTALERQPNRVILRMRVKDFDGNYSWFTYPTAIKTYLTWAGRSVTDYTERKHNVYVEVYGDPEINQRHFHIIIDFCSLSFDVQDFNQVHHELFLIERDDKGEL